MQHKPCGLLDVGGYYARLLAFVDHATDEGFVPVAQRRLVLSDDDPGRLLDALNLGASGHGQVVRRSRRTTLESCRSYVWPWPRSTRRSVIWRVTPTWSSSGRGGPPSRAHLVAFPEMMLTGYPIEDLALRPSFVEASRATLESVARRLADAGHGDVLVVVGYLDGQRGAAPVVGTPRGAPQNALAFLHGGRVVARYAKHHLPNYGVFDEYRYFVPGDALRWYG